MPRIIIEKTPPVKAKGIPVNIMVASFNEPKAKINKPTIRIKVRGITNLRRCVADCNFL